MSSAPLLNISLGLDCFDSCCSGIAVTCWWRSDIDSQAINTALCVTTSDPEAVVGVGLQVSHSQPAACCCTSIQHSISIYEGKAHKMEEKSHRPSTEQESRTAVAFPRQINFVHLMAVRQFLKYTLTKTGEDVSLREMNSDWDELRMIKKRGFLYWGYARVGNGKG